MTTAVLISLLVQFGVVWQVRGKISAGFSDFCDLYTGGRIVASPDRSSLYDFALQRRVESSFKAPAAQEKFLYYIHAPYEALFFALLSGLPYPDAFWTFFAINLVLAFLALFLMRSQVPDLREAFYLVILACGVFQPLLVTEGQGQDSIVTLLLFVVCCLSLARGSAAIAGASLGLAVYKPQYVAVMILILVLVSERRWRILAGFLSACAVSAAMSVAAVGWSTTMAFPRILEAFSQFNDVRSDMLGMPNLDGLVYRLFSDRVAPGILDHFLQAVSLAAFVATIWALRRGGPIERGFSLKFALAVTYVFVFAWYAFFHDMTALLIPLLLVWNRLARSGVETWNQKLLGATMLALLCGGLFSILTPTVFACLSLLFFVLLLFFVANDDAWRTALNPSR